MPAGFLSFEDEELHDGFCVCVFFLFFFFFFLFCQFSSSVPPKQWFT